MLRFVRNVLIGLASMFVGALALMWLFVWMPYEVVISTEVVIGFVASFYIIASWLPLALKAYRRKDHTVSLFSIIDIAGMSLVGVIVFALRIYVSATDGVPVPSVFIMRIIGIGTWTLITSLMCIRAYAWHQTKREHSAEDVLTVVSEHQIDRRSAG